jgi:hypothetical protein
VNGLRSALAIICTEILHLPRVYVRRRWLGDPIRSASGAMITVKCCLLNVIFRSRRLGDMLPTGARKVISFARSVIKLSDGAAKSATRLIAPLKTR